MLRFFFSDIWNVSSPHAGGYVVPTGHMLSIYATLIVSFAPFAPTSMPLCPGCGGSFAAGRALSLHVVNSTDICCLKARYDAEALLSDSDEEFGPSSASDFPTGGGSFTGDFFGEDYTQADFDFGSDDSDPDPDPCDDSDDDDPVAGDYAAAAEAHAANGWEPDRPTQHNQEEDLELEDAARPSTAAPPLQEKRKIAEDRFHETPIIIKYPSDRAGEEITDECSPSAAEDQYSAALGQPNNIYAPFNSKLDWEIARWAKLRGAGSTAFTDLLKIDGVIFFDVCLRIVSLNCLPGCTSIGTVVSELRRTEFYH
jgi:hypothetical protein